MPGESEGVGEFSSETSGVTVESTPLGKEIKGIRTGTVTVKTEYHVLKDGTVVFGSLEKALGEKAGVSEKPTGV